MQADIGTDERAEQGREPVRRNTHKRAAADRAVQQIRLAYRLEHPHCQWIGCQHRGEDLHEIVRGPDRRKALGVPAALLHLCQEHHLLVHSQPSIVRDLAVKWVDNDGTFDIELIAQLRGRPASSITTTDVLDAAECLLNEQLE